MFQEITSENFNQMLGKFTTTELEGLLAKYPYFQQAHLLLAKKYQLENNPRFDQQLQLAALYTNDSELLFRIFNERTLVAKTIYEEPTVKQVVETAVEMVINPGYTEPLVVNEVAAVVEMPTEPVIETTATAEPLVIAPQAEETAVIEDAPPIKEAVADVPQIEEVVAVEQEPVLENQLPQTDLFVPVQEVEEQALMAAVEEQPVYEKKAEIQLGPNADATILPAEEPTVFEAKQPHTFQEWLAAFNNSQKINVDAVEEETEPVTAPEEVIEEDPELAAQQDEELNKTILSHAPSTLIQELVAGEANFSKGLNQFIDEQIQKHRQPEVKRPASENDIDSELITETLAKLYEKQKKYTKALKAYEVLSLKYPEKSDLFAARISFLKGLV